MTISDILMKSSISVEGGGGVLLCPGWLDLSLPIDALAESHRGLGPAIQLLNSWASLALNDQAP